jgi:hypothetical protein
MLLLLSGLVLAAQFPALEDCIYDGVPAADRTAIGEAILARHTEAAADLTMEATNRCAHQYHWSVDKAVQLNGYATMRFAADVLAARLGKPEWTTSALRAIRLRSLDQVKTLAGTGTDIGNAEFRLVLARMIGADPTLADRLKAMDKPDLKSFVLMVKLVAVAEVSRLDG